MRRPWVKLWVSILRSKDFMAMPENNRFVWIGLLMLAGDSPFPGKIGVSEDMGYTSEQIASMLKTDPKTVDETISKMGIDAVIVSDGGVIKICHWENYQSEYQRQKPYRQGYKVKLQSEVTNKVTSPCLKSSPSPSPSPSPSESFDFESIWKQYPNKDGKKAAKGHFDATVKTMGDYVNMQKALKNYLESDKVKRGFLKNGSTWFNNWQDWIDFKGVSNDTRTHRQGSGVPASDEEARRYDGKA